MYFTLKHYIWSHLLFGVIFSYIWSIFSYISFVYFALERHDLSEVKSLYVFILGEET